MLRPISEWQGQGDKRSGRTESIIGRCVCVRAPSPPRIEKWWLGHEHGQCQFQFGSPKALSCNDRALLRGSVGGILGSITRYIHARVERVWFSKGRVDLQGQRALAMKYFFFRARRGALQAGDNCRGGKRGKEISRH